MILLPTAALALLSAPLVRWCQTFPGAVMGVVSFVLGSLLAFAAFPQRRFASMALGSLLLVNGGVLLTWADRGGCLSSLGTQVILAGLVVGLVGVVAALVGLRWFASRKTQLSTVRRND